MMSIIIIHGHRREISVQPLKAIWKANDSCALSSGTALYRALPPSRHVTDLVLDVAAWHHYTLFLPEALGKIA